MIAVYVVLTFRRTVMMNTNTVITIVEAIIMIGVPMDDLIPAAEKKNLFPGTTDQTWHRNGTEVTVRCSSASAARRPPPSTYRRADIEAWIGAAATRAPTARWTQNPDNLGPPEKEKAPAVTKRQARPGVSRPHHQRVNDNRPGRQAPYDALVGNRRRFGASRRMPPIPTCVCGRCVRDPDTDHTGVAARLATTG